MSEAEKPRRIAFEVTSIREIEPDENFASTTTALVTQVTQVDVQALSASLSALVDELTLAFRPKPGGPASTEVSFGLKISAEGSLIVSKLGGEVSVGVKVIWDRT